MRILILALVAAFMISGCSSVKAYKYKRDRVDQKMQQGNRGYLKGTPPAADDRTNLQRTMYGVDIEIAVMPWEKEKITIPPDSGKVEKPPMVDEEVFYEIPAKNETQAAHGKSVETIKGEMVETEEEWIK